MFTETRSTASELDGLPDVDRKETEEILAEIDKDEKQDDQKSPEEAEAEANAKAAADAKAKADADAKAEADAKAKAEAEGKGRSEERKNRQPGLMPRYVHEIAVKDHEAKVASLMAQIEQLKQGKGPESKKEETTTPEQRDALKSKIADVATKLSEKHPGVSKDLIADLATSLVDLGIKPAEIPQEISEKLKAVDEWKAAQQASAEEQAYNAAFDKDITPLIKSEYGDLPADTIQEIRALLMEKAYEGTYGPNVPLAVIYKGLDDFRSFKRTAARSAEPSKGGTERGGTGEGDDENARFENATESDIDKMSSEEFDRYTKWAEANERRRGNAS